MGDEEEARFAEQQAELDQRFAGLPAPGSAGYWQAVAGTEIVEPPPLEVLARCFRERDAAGRRDHADRLFELIQGRVQQMTQAWAKRIVRFVPAHSRNDLADELESDCYFELWQALRNPEQRFILKNFTHVLRWVQDHAAHARMQSEGYWKRPSVETPNRIPRGLTDSLDRPPARQPDAAAAVQPLPDPVAASAFIQVEQAADIQRLLAQLSPEDRALVYDLYWAGLSQQEVAARLGKTDRTVRNYITRILAKLRLLAGQGEEDDRDA
ncbi:MAG: RNA polymerase sigma factor [Ktedonobacterales bacterium]